MAELRIVAGLALLFLSACGKSPVPACPDPASVTPPTIGTAFVTNLTARLALGDRENTISEAITAIRQRDPSLDATTITDILVAADCPNALAKSDNEPDADRARIAAFRAQVDQLLKGPPPPQGEPEG